MNRSPYADLTACTLVPEANVSYLAHTSGVPSVTHLDGSAMGLMMILSAFQYQAPYMGPTYSNAFKQAGKAAYVESGGQKMQDGLSKYGADQAHEAGMTDAEGVVIFGTAKTIRSKELKLNGPRVYSVKTSLTLSPNKGIMGLKYEF